MLVSVRESKARFSELLSKALEGEDVVITMRGRPVATLVPVKTAVGEADMKKWAASRRGELLRQPVSDSASGESIVNDLRQERF